MHHNTVQAFTTSEVILELMRGSLNTTCERCLLMSCIIDIYSIIRTFKDFIAIQKYQFFAAILVVFLAIYFSTASSLEIFDFN